MGRAADQRRVILIGLRLDGRGCGREKYRAAAIMATCECVPRRRGTLRSQVGGSMAGLISLGPQDPPSPRNCHQAKLDLDNALEL